MSGQYVTTNAALNVNGTTFLAGNASINTGSADISFLGAVDGNKSLTVTSTGLTTLDAAVGSNSALLSVNLNSSALSLHDVSTVGSQLYTANSTVTHSTYLSDGSEIVFNSPVVINSNLVVNTTGAGSVAGANITFVNSITSPGQASNIMMNAGTGGLVSILGATSANAVNIVKASGANITNIGNAFNQISGNIGVAGLSVIDSTGLTVSASGINSEAGNVRLISTSGDMTLNGAISATGAGSIVLAATSGNFINNVGSHVLTTSTGTWTVYSSSPLLDTNNGLAPQFKVYNANLSSSLPVGTAGQSGYVYTVAPVVSAVLEVAPGDRGIEKVYDANRTATIDALNYNTTIGSIAGDIVTLNNPTSGVYDDRNVGEGKLVTVGNLSIASARNGNVAVYGYRIANTTISANIGIVTQAYITVVGLVALDKVYNGLDNDTLSVAAAAFNGVLTNSDNGQRDIVGNLTTASGYFTDVNVGTNINVTATRISMSGRDAGNYQLVPVSGLKANITQAPLVVTATGVNRAYDGTLNATVNLVGNAIAADVANISISDASAVFLDKNIGTNKYINVSGITISGSAASNYYVFNSSTSAFANVTKADLTFTATALDKVYDRTTNVSANVSIDQSFARADGLNVSSFAAAFVTANAGLRGVNVSGINITGDFSNYNTNYSLTATTTANISQRQLTVSGQSAVNKVYDATTNATLVNGTLSGVINGDTVTLSQSGQFATPNVGVNISVTATDTIGGSSASNYVLVQPTGLSASITPGAVTLSVSGQVAQDKVYDGTNIANFTGGTLIGVQTGDNVTLVRSGVFASKDVGTNIAINVTDTLTGSSASNYMLVEPTGLTANITARPLTISTASGYYKFYDASTLANISLLNNALSGDNLVLNYSAANFVTPNTGYDKVINVVGAAIIGGNNSGNYYVANPTFNTTGNIIVLNGSLAPTGPITGYKPTFSSADYHFAGYSSGVKPPPSPFHPNWTGNVEILSVDCGPDDNDPNCEPPAK